METSLPEGGAPQCGIIGSSILRSYSGMLGHKQRQRAQGVERASKFPRSHFDQTCWSKSNPERPHLDTGRAQGNLQSGAVLIHDGASTIYTKSALDLKESGTFLLHLLSSFWLLKRKNEYGEKWRCHSHSLVFTTNWRCILSCLCVTLEASWNIYILICLFHNSWSPRTIQNIHRPKALWLFHSDLSLFVSPCWQSLTALIFYLLLHWPWERSLLFSLLRERKKNTPGATVIMLWEWKGSVKC